MDDDLSTNNNNNKRFQQTSTSLPLLTTDLCTLGSVVEPGMDVMPSRTSTHGPYHNHHANLSHHHNFHHHTDQTKSLQELQNEVGALLEFRDLVIETFPDLKHKMASSGANSTITGLQSSSSIVSRREWEPGIRVRRKLNSNLSKDGSSNSSGGGGNGDMIQSSLLIRSRSNSHSGKKEPKSGGEGNGSVIQDSGFSTETSSSKDAHSASSTAGSAGVQGNSSALTARLSSDSNNSDNELWNLLDVIHRRTSRLADEIDNYQKFNNRTVPSAAPGTSSSSSFQSQLNFMSKDDVQILRKERDHLLDKMGDMEAEFLANGIKETKLQEQLNKLQQTKVELEEQLKVALNQKYELNRLTSDLQIDGSSQLTQLSDSQVISPIVKNRPSTTFQPIPMKPQKFLKLSGTDDSANSSVQQTSKQLKDELNQLGRLDGLISNPSSKLNKVRVPDSKKIAAILLETNIVELQRHLLTITVQNQVLQQRLEQATKSKIYLIKKLDKSKDEMEDLRFQIEERNIELEGTRAQLRVMETKLANRSDSSPEHQLTSTTPTSNTNRLSSLTSRDTNNIMHTSTPSRQMQHSQTISTPSMKAMIPLAMEDAFQHSSSTESAHDQQERDLTMMIKYPETPKRSKPSKIPLPGSKGVVAKPPSGRPAGPASNKSLTKSTSSLYNGNKSSGPPSISTKRDTSLTRTDSVQSWRNMSFDGKSRSSSIPISNKPVLSVASSPNGNYSPPTTYGPTIVTIPSSPGINSKYVTSSPLPRPKRDSLTTKVKHLDSLSRLQSSSTGMLQMTVGKSPAYSPNVVTTNSTNGSNNRKHNTALPVRRMSNVSMGRDMSDTNGSNNGDTNGGKVQHQFNIKPFNVQSNVMTKSWTTSSIASAVETRNEEDTTMFQSRDLIREYLLKTRVPEILKPQQSRRFSPLPNFATSTMSDMNLAYKHPLVIAEELKNDGGEGLAWAESSIGRKLPSAPDNSSIIVPRKIQQRKKSIEDRPHLIRKVTPSIAKTWEQLTSTMERSMNESEASDDDDDKQSYVLFVRNPYNFQQSNDDFAVNKINHEPSEKFYDSIDNVDDYYPDYEDDEVTSGTETEAGEMMAEELDSLEMRCNDVIVWSIES